MVKDKTLYTLAQIAGSDANALFEYLYDDGVAWGVGTATEAERDAPYSNADVATLRFRRLA